MGGRGWLRVVSLAACFTVLAVCYTWPLARAPSATFVFPQGTATGLAEADALLTSWILSWGAHALRSQPWRLFEANVLYPLTDTLALSEHMLAGALLVLPLDVLHHDPVLANNLVLLATFVIGGVGTAVLARTLGAPGYPALLAGVLAFFGPLRLAELGQVHALSWHWFPLVLASFERTRESGSRRAAAAFALTLVLQGLSSVYLAYYTMLAVVGVAVLHRVLRTPFAPRAWTSLALGGAAAGLVLGVVMLPYQRVSAAYDLARAPGEALLYSARGVTYLGALLHPIAHLRQQLVAPGWPIAIIGVPFWGLALLGVRYGAPAARGGRRLAFVYLGLAAWIALLSCGPRLQLYPSLEGGIPGPHALLARVLPGFDALRAPMRAAGLAVVPLAALAGLGAGGLLAGRGGAARTAWTIGLGIAALASAWHPPLAVVPVSWQVPGPPARHRWLAEQPGRDAVIELPYGAPVADARAMALSTYHWRPLVNAYTGFAPFSFSLRGALAWFPDARATEVLARLGVRWVIVNTADFAAARTPSPCTAARLTAAARVRVAFEEPDGCVLEILLVVPPPPPPLVPVAVRRALSSDGATFVPDAAGRFDQPFTQAVDRATSGWLALELAHPARVARLVLHLGSAFGHYLRQYRVETSRDGREWVTVRDERVGEAPLESFRRDARALEVTIDLPGPDASWVRIVRPADRGEWAYDLWGDWHRWGAAGVSVYALPPASAPSAGVSQGSGAPVGPGAPVT